VVTNDRRAWNVVLSLPNKDEVLSLSNVGNEAGALLEDNCEIVCIDLVVVTNRVCDVDKQIDRLATVAEMR